MKDNASVKLIPAPARALLWLAITGADNRLRGARGGSPLLRLLARPPCDSAVLRDNAVVEFLGPGPGRLRVFAGDDPAAPSAADDPAPLAMLDLFDRRNPALILRRMLGIKLQAALRGLRLEDIHLFHRGLWRDDALAALLAPFASQCRTGPLRGARRFRRLLECGNAPFWPLFRDAAPLAELRRQVYRAHGIAPAPPARAARRVVFVRRRDPPDNFAWRKIANEDAVIAALAERFPHTRAVSLEDLPVRAQLETVNRADMLVGMHGAGLGYAMLLAPNAGLLELFPSCAGAPHWFYTFYAVAAARGLHYRRWVQWRPWRNRQSDALRRSPPESPETRGDLTCVPPAAVVRSAAALARRIERGAARAAR